MSKPERIDLDRRRLLGALCYAPAAAILARNFAWAQSALTVTALSDHVHLIAGDGGNVAALTGPDGLLVIDSGLPDGADGLAAKLQEVSKGPVAQLINTHWHFDHVGGNARFGKSGTKIIATEKAKARMITKQTVAFLKMNLEPLPAEGRPSAILAPKGTIAFAGEKVHHQQLAPAHTDSDTVFHFQNANVFHAGDLYFAGVFPFIDYSSGGSIEGMIANAAAMLKMVDSSTKIIPGHGPLSNKAELTQYHDMLSAVNEKVTPLIKSGKTAEQLVAANPLADLNAKWGGGFMKPEAFLQMLYQGKTKA